LLINLLCYVLILHSLVFLCCRLCLKAARVLAEQGWLEYAVAEIDAAGLIAAIVPQGEFDLDLGPAWLMPALIDVHGAAGFDAMDASSEALDQISMYFARFGAGVFLATTVTAPLPAIAAALREVKAGRERGLPRAELIGSNLEGPYFTAKCCGAHPVQWMRPLDVAELQHWLDIAGDSLHALACCGEERLVLITCAQPAWPMALISWARCL
jgi:N-acetylgalactosamine-6-phosphate deacetylase